MGLHVAPRGKRWAVSRTGKSRALRLFDLRDDALAFAKHMSERPIYVFSKVGILSERIANDRTEAAMERPVRP